VHLVGFCYKNATYNSRYAINMMQYTLISPHPALHRIIQKLHKQEHRNNSALKYDNILEFMFILVRNEVLR